MDIVEIHLGGSLCIRHAEILDISRSRSRVSETVYYTIAEWICWVVLVERVGLSPDLASHASTRAHHLVDTFPVYLLTVCSLSSWDIFLGVLSRIFGHFYYYNRYIFNHYNAPWKGATATPSLFKGGGPPNPPNGAVI